MDISLNTWKAITLIVALLFIASLYFNFTGSGAATQVFVNQNEAATITDDFVTNNLLPPGIDLEVTKVEDIGSVYELTLNIGDGTETTEATVYLSKDGKHLFFTEYTIEDSGAPQVSFDAPDSAIPKVDFFVMSFCPYGQQAEAGLAPVAALLEGLVEFEPHYVIYEYYADSGPAYCIEDGTLCSMHGIDELNENIRQLCIWNNYDSSIWWDYIEYVNTQCSLTNIETCWKEAANSVGIDTSLIESCQADQGTSLMQAERDLNIELEVSGSPTIFINNERYSESRSAEALKIAICTAFTQKPEQCATELSGSSADTTGSC